MSPLLIPLGLLIGVALGALGGGGSILTVPALVYVVGQDPRTATTSALLIVGVTSLIVLLPHARAGRVRLGQGLVFGTLGTASSLAGSALSARVSPSVLLTAFAGLMGVVATLMLVRTRRSPQAEPDASETARPDPCVRALITMRPWSCACPRLVKVVATATAAGLMTGFFGVGGGFVLVPALVLALEFPMPVAVGTSLLVIAVNSATALLSRMSSGVTSLDWSLIAWFTAAAVVGSLAGGRLTSRLDPRHLTRAFAGLLVAVAVYSAARSIPALG